MDNPYAAPTSDIEPETTAVEYIGFWKRVLASLVDSVLLLAISLPLLFMIYGQEQFVSGEPTYGVWYFIINYGLPFVAVMLFWRYRGATPGKMLFDAVIVDASTFAAPSTGQLIGRYLGYFVSTIPLLLGLIWVGFDKRKQGWHDKLAGTVVARRASLPAAVR